MTRAAERVLAWARLYTRGLPADVAAARLDEIRSDVHEHYAAVGGATTAQVDRAVVQRAIRGVHDDLAWRGAQFRAEARRRYTSGAMGLHRGLIALALTVSALSAAAGAKMLIEVIGGGAVHGIPFLPAFLLGLGAASAFHRLRVRTGAVLLSLAVLFLATGMLESLRWLSGTLADSYLRLVSWAGLPVALVPLPFAVISVAIIALVVVASSRLWSSRPVASA